MQTVPWGCGDSVLAWGTVCPSWFWFFISHLCPTLKAVDGHGCNSLACHARGCAENESLDPVRVRRETPTGCNDQALIKKKLIFILFYAGAEPFPRAFLELCFKDKGHSVSQWSRESMLLLNSAWCFMPLVHYLMGNMMR